MSPRAVQSVLVEVPATTANLGAGFDALGLALDLTNVLEFTVTDTPGVRVYIDGPGAGSLPRDESHLAVQAAWRFFDEVQTQRPLGLTVHQHIGVPLAGGLGSSATAVVGGILAAAALSEAEWDMDRLLEVASSIEGHPDNVAPALLGGLVVSVRQESGKVCAISVPVNEAWAPAAVLAVPDFELKTADARAVLQPTVPLADAVYNVGRAALFVAAAAAGRTECLSVCMADRLHQAQRSRLIPGLDAVFEAAQSAGALGVALSGAGPTVVALTQPALAETVGDAMARAFAEAGVFAQIIHTTPRYDGATVRITRS